MTQFRTAVNRPAIAQIVLAGAFDFYTLAQDDKQAAIRALTFEPGTPGQREERITRRDEAAQNMAVWAPAYDAIMTGRQISEPEARQLWEAYLQTCDEHPPEAQGLTTDEVITALQDATFYAQRATQQSRDTL